MAEREPFVWEEFVEEVGRDPYLDQAQGEFDEAETSLRIVVTSNWVKKTIESRHLTRIREQLHRRYPGRAVRVTVVVDESFVPSGGRMGGDILEPPTEISPERATRQEDRPSVLPVGPDASTGLNPRYTFDHFVVGSSNRLAYAAALGIAEQPDGSRANPLFVYGGVGLGKTHLLHAIGNFIRERHPHLRVLYVSAETFTNDTVEAIRSNQTSAIRNKYRTMDVLLMDDIQFLQQKAQTQIEFHHTFNDLHNANKQIVLASDSSPNDLSALEERVKSRFMWGMVTSIDPPEYETRIAILQRKAEELNIQHFPSEVAEFIAEHVTTNIRELEGTLSTVFRHAELQGRELDLDLVREVLKVDEEEDVGFDTFLTTTAIQNVVADYFGMKASELKSRRRTKRVATVRHIAMYLCRQLTDLSLVDIGRDFGGRDHSTVISACLKIEREIERDPQLAETIELLTRRLTGKGSAIGR